MDAGEQLLATWEDALIAPALLAVDPIGLGGVCLRAPPGPVRTAWVNYLSDVLGPAPWVRLPPSLTEDRLLGGIDLAASLSAQRLVLEQGILARADGGSVVVPMAERLEGIVVSQLGVALDFGACSLERDGISQKLSTRLSAILLDEGLDDERVAASLLERVALHLDLRTIPPRWSEELAPDFDRDDVQKARSRLSSLEVEPGIIESLAAASIALGIDSLRAVQFALRIAKCHRALLGGDAVTDQDIRVAARLVYASRATQIPESSEPSPEDEASANEPTPEDEAESSELEMIPLEDLIVAAVQTSLPDGLLATLSQGLQRRGQEGKGGGQQKSKLRGRPVGHRPGDPRRDGPLDLVSTLRAAVPWQRIRHQGVKAQGRLAVQESDFRVRKFRHRSASVTVFVVDASGSSAFARLAEAKGAVESLLGDCYSRRDEVALIAFRGEGAELLLPPTRALARAKRCLADLPGGGATPLAAGLEAGWLLAEDAQRDGKTPTLVVMTDGKANVARDGSHQRSLATEHALEIGRRIAASGYKAVCIDISARPSRHAKSLAEAMQAKFLALPRAESEAIAQAVR